MAAQNSLPLGSITLLIIVTVLLISNIPFAEGDANENNRIWSQQVERKSTSSCGETSRLSTRKLIEDFISADEIDWLKQLVIRGMKVISDQAGPTIMDPDLGLVLGPGGNVKRVEEAFSDEELTRYGKLLKRVYDKVVEVHELPQQSLFHTAPTFIAKLTPFKNSGKPIHVHDEYWHLHCDKNNTEHYDYSALVYLSDYDKDFEGGLFEFHDDSNVTTIKPKKGALLTFSSGIENAHRVDIVTKGERLAWSLWFTCDKSKRFVKSRLKLEHDEL